MTQKGQAIIGDLRTDALHEALQDENADIDSEHMVALLVLAFAGRNVSVQSGAALGKSDREQIAETLTEGGTLTRDAGLNPHRRARDAGRRTVLPGQHDQQRRRRAHRRRQRRGDAAPA